MAGDWIRIDLTLPEKPEVVAIAAQMEWDDIDMTVGKLIRCFVWFNRTTTDLTAPHCSLAMLDRLLGAPGFARAMESVGWLSETDAGLSLNSNAVWGCEE